MSLDLLAVHSPALLAISDPVWNAIIAGMVAIVLAWMDRRMARRSEQTWQALKAQDDLLVQQKKKLAARVERAAAATRAQLADIAQTSDAVHTLVNSSMSNQLRVSMLALKRVAVLTEHPDDVEAARVAEAAYYKHEAKQRVLDASERDAAAKAAGHGGG